jgi:hypothetical protein
LGRVSRPSDESVQSVDRPDAVIIMFVSIQIHTKSIFFKLEILHVRQDPHTHDVGSNSSVGRPVRSIQNCVGRESDRASKERWMDVDMVLIQIIYMYAYQGKYRAGSRRATELEW